MPSEWFPQCLLLCVNINCVYSTPISGLLLALLAFKPLQFVPTHLLFPRKDNLYAIAANLA